MSDRCQNSWFGSHQFEPRYDKEPSNAMSLGSIKARDVEMLDAMVTKRTYVRDICVRCGNTVERATQ
jgi:hypothetical protein